MEIFNSESKKIKERFYNIIEKTGYKYPKFMISIDKQIKLWNSNIPTSSSLDWDSIFDGLLKNIDKNVIIQGLNDRNVIDTLMYIFNLYRESSVMLISPNSD